MLPKNIRDEILRVYVDQVFSKYDTDNSETLDEEEMTYFFNDLFKLLGIQTKVTIQMSLEAIKSIDQNYDGAIDKKELFDAFKVMMETQNKNELQYIPPPPGWGQPPNGPWQNQNWNQNPYWNQNPNYGPNPYWGGGNPGQWNPNWGPNPQYPPFSQQNPHQNQQDHYNPFQPKVHKPNPNHRKAKKPHEGQNFYPQQGAYFGNQPKENPEKNIQRKVTKSDDQYTYSVTYK